MSKKRCKTKIKIKKDKKENKFKNQIKNIILCDWDKCIKNWNEIIEVQNLGNLYFCSEHKIKFDEETPKLQDYFTDKEIEQMKNNHFISKEVIENCERKKCNNKSDNHLQVVLKLNETILTDYFFCNEHTNEYKNKIWPERLEQFKKINKYQKIINNLELIINEI